jgi:uncharacterized protein (UPF0276 family)
MTPVQGAGLGLRRSFIGAAIEHPPAAVDFYEVAPENWIGVGGRFGRQLRAMTERHPFVCHGLSLSIGSPAPLDLELVGQIKQFLDSHGIRAYTEHLSFCSDDGHLYDLMPMPFTGDAVRHVAERVRQVQDILGRRIALENVSYYATPGCPDPNTSPLPNAAPIPTRAREMTEIEFLEAVLSEADCDLLLDLNNIYVNSINQGYDAVEFLAALPAQRILYGHIAGHYVEAPDLRIDTHGADVIEPVWALLDLAYARFGVFPTLLERDFNIPPLEQLSAEVARIAALQRRHQGSAATAAHA